MTNAVTDHFKIPHDLWNRSSVFYCNNAVFAPQLNSIVGNFPWKFMVEKNYNYNELKKPEVYSLLIDVATKQEDILVVLLKQFMGGVLEAKDVPLVLDEMITKMYDDIWMEMGIEQEELFNEFFDHKCPFNARYIEIRDASWRRLAQKLTVE